MQVLHIVSGRLFGGVETMLVTVARCRLACPTMKPEFALCYGGRLKEELVGSGVPVHMLGEARARNPLSVLRARRQLRKLLTERSADIVICHMPWAEAMFGGVARAAGIPLVFWMHGVPKNVVVTKVDDRPINSADALVAAVRSKAPGDKVTLTYQVPGGGSRTVQVTLGKADQ